MGWRVTQLNVQRPTPNVQLRRRNRRPVEDRWSRKAPYPKDAAWAKNRRSVFWSANGSRAGGFCRRVKWSASSNMFFSLCVLGDLCERFFPVPLGGDSYV